MAQNVSIEGRKVESRGWTTEQNKGYSSLMRAVSSYSRAVVKHLPCETTLLQKVQASFEDAVETAHGEQHLRQVVKDCPDVNQAAESPVQPQDFVDTVVRIIKTKTKRLKQHSRRASAREKKQKQDVQQKRAKWPKELEELAEDFKNWNQDIFLHIAMSVLSDHFTQKGMEVRIADGIQDTYRRIDIKEQIACHGSVLGLADYAIPESKEHAMAAQAQDSWDEFYNNLDFWLEQDAQGNFCRVTAL